MIAHLLLFCILCNGRNGWGWGIWVSLGSQASSPWPLQFFKHQRWACNLIGQRHLGRCGWWLVSRSPWSLLLSLSFSPLYVDKKTHSPSWGLAAILCLWERKWGREVTRTCVLDKIIESLNQPNPKAYPALNNQSTSVVRGGIFY